MVIDASMLSILSLTFSQGVGFIWAKMRAKLRTVTSKQNFLLNDIIVT